MMKRPKHILIVLAMMLLFVSASAQLSMPDTVCVGNTKIYKVNGASASSTYTWKIDGMVQTATKNEIIVTWTRQGKFLIVAQEHSNDGCDGEIQSGYVYVNTTLPGIRYPTVTAVENVAKQLSARDLGSGSKYNWSPSAGLNYTNVRTPVFQYDKPVEYSIAIQPATGCKLVDTLQVLVTPPLTGKSALYVPNAWTPNNDGLNDRLYPVAVNIKELYYFRVYNRWGQLVFETKRPGDGWDGRFNGKVQQTGVYAWTVKAVGHDGIQYQQSGTAILIR